MYTFWQALAITPWWFYLLAIMLIHISFAALKPRFISFKELLLTPTFFMTFYLVALYYLIDLTSLNIILWICMMIAGCVVGWLQCKTLGLKANPESGQFYIPGSSLFFVFCLLITSFALYILRYYLTQVSIIPITPTLFHQTKYGAWLVMTYGFFTGSFLGRLLYAKHCLRLGPFYL